MTITTLNSYEPERGREFTMWTSAALVVCALHVGLAATYLLLKPEPEARAEAPAFEVAFVPATAPPAPAVPETQQTADQPPIPEQPSVDPPAEDPPPPPQAAVPEPEPPPAQVEAMAQPEPLPPPLALSPPELPAVTDVPEEVAVLPPPDAKPVEVAPPPEKVTAPPPERASRKPVRDEKVDRKPPAKPAAPAPSRPARVAMAPNPGVESAGAAEGRASWNSQLVAQIRRFATYSGTETGSVSVSVTIDRNGRLKSRRLVSSSGSATLDRVAMDVLERAQPFPAFPPGMTEAQVVRVVPMHLRPR